MLFRSEQVIAKLTEAYALYAIRNDDAAAGSEKLAEQIVNVYNVQNEPSVRIDLPEMRELKLIAIKQFFSSAAYPLYVRKGLRDRMQIEMPKLWEELMQTDAELTRKLQELKERE